MGDKAEDLLQSFNLTDEEAKKYSIVKAKFEVKRRNAIYERAKFKRRKQEDSETVDEFVTDLYRHRLAEHCEYGILHDELVRDRIVVGIKEIIVQKASDDPGSHSRVSCNRSATERSSQKAVRGEVLRE